MEIIITLCALFLGVVVANTLESRHQEKHRDELKKARLWFVEENKNKKAKVVFKTNGQVLETGMFSHEATTYDYYNILLDAKLVAKKHLEVSIKNGTIVDKDRTYYPMCNVSAMWVEEVVV